MAKMPEQKPGKSEQVVCTPPEFLEAVKQRLTISGFDIDLAADATNSVAGISYYDEKANALVLPWRIEYSDPGWAWCNPPYADLEPWVEKAYQEADKGAKVAMLVPASVGSAWWFRYVSRKAYVTYLHPRLTFVGHKSPYPKDLALLLYAPFLCGGSTNWVWK